MKILKQKLEYDKAPSWLKQDVSLPVYTTLLKFDLLQKDKIALYFTNYISYKDKKPDIWVRVLFHNLSKVQATFVAPHCNSEFQIFLMNGLEPTDLFTKELGKLNFMPCRKEITGLSWYRSVENLDTFKADSAYLNLIDFLNSIDKK